VAKLPADSAVPGRGATAVRAAVGGIALLLGAASVAGTIRRILADG
jgi:hypothetical protein